MSERLRKAGHASRRALEQAKTQSGHMLGRALDKSADITDAAGTKSRALVGRASDGGKQALSHIEEHPLRYIATGVVLGLVVGALLPKFRNEDKLVSKVGQIFSDSVQKIADAAADALKPDE